MINRILIALGIRKKPEPDTQAKSIITELYASGKLPKHKVSLGSRVSSSQVPPKVPPQRFASQPESYRQLEPVPMVYDPVSSLTIQPVGYPLCEPFAGKGGEFSGAGASESWDSPSYSSTDTSSSSSDSGSSSCGGD